MIYLEQNKEKNQKKEYRSILKKSIHNKSTRFRDELMNITNLSTENTIRLFIDNLEDFKKIL